VSIPLDELTSVKRVEQRGTDILEVKRTTGGQTLQLLTNEVGYNPARKSDPLITIL